jgi:hypothetical protein
VAGASSQPQKIRFAPDSALEGRGFEPSVPGPLIRETRMSTLQPHALLRPNGGDTKSLIWPSRQPSATAPPTRLVSVLARGGNSEAANHRFLSIGTQSAGNVAKRPLSPAATQLGLRSGGGSACPSSMGFPIHGSKSARQGSPRGFLTKQIASLTGTRTRCSTFGHGLGLRRQERRTAVGVGQV